MNLVLIRHTTVATEAGLCYGWSDVPLGPDFVAEAEAVRARLPERPWRIVSSPAERCQRLAAFFGAQVELDPRLRELNFGTWEQRRWDALPRSEIDLWAANFVTGSPPDGETFEALATRAEAFVSDCSRRFAGETLLAVTHAGVIRALLARRRGLPLKDAFSIPVELGGVYPLPTQAVAAPIS